MKLLNVRLATEDFLRVRALHKKGVQISQLLRQAIRSEYDRQRRRLTPKEARALLETIYADYPEPPNLPRPSYNVHDRHEFRDAIARRVRRGREP